MKQEFKAEVNTDMKKESGIKTEPGQSSESSAMDIDGAPGAEVKDEMDDKASGKKEPGSIKTENGSTIKMESAAIKMESSTCGKPPAQAPKDAPATGDATVPNKPRSKKSKPSILSFRSFVLRVFSYLVYYVSFR